jgi:hypothetical protein
MTTGKHSQRRAGVRFTYLLRQLEEDGWTQTAVAAAIGCHQTLISKWWWRGALPYDAAQKGLRDDVIQGVFEGLGVRSDFLFMSKPKGYPNTIKLPSGETRTADPDELDHKDFRVITNDEFERARDRKERVALQTRVGALEEQLATNNAQLAQLLSLLAKDKQSAR